MLIYFVIFVRLGSFHIRWWDESIYAVNAYEMIQNGNYFVPFFENMPDHFNAKPPLTIWTQILLIKLLGYNELAVRLPSAIAASAVVIILFFFLGKRFGSLIAWTSTLILLTSKGFIGFHTARTGDTDSIFTLFTFLSCIYLFKYTESQSNKNILPFFVFLTLAYYTKIYAILLFAPSFTIILIRHKTLIRFLTCWQSVAGILIFIGTAIGLAIVRNNFDPEYINASWTMDIGRFVTKLNKGNEPYSFYFENLATTRFSLWFIPLLIGILTCFTSRGKDNIIIDLTIITSSFLLLLTVSQTKFFWYDMPMYPLMATIAAFGLQKMLQPLKDTASKRGMIFIMVCTFAFPYWILFCQSQANIIPSSEKLNEANELFLYKHRNDGVLPDTFKVYHYGWKGSVLFYKYKLSSRNIQMNIITSDSINISDKILVSNDSLFNVVRSNYSFSPIIFDGKSRLVKITGKIDRIL